MRFAFGHLRRLQQRSALLRRLQQNLKAEVKEIRTR